MKESFIGSALLVTTSFNRINRMMRVTSQVGLIMHHHHQQTLIENKLVPGFQFAYKLAKIHLHVRFCCAFFYPQSVLTFDNVSVCEIRHL
jgi:hypothetical protein